MISRSTVLAVVFFGALVNFGWIFGASKVREFEGDAPFYLALGESLAKPQPDYLNPKSFWPQTPAMDRAPGWPALISLAIRVAPGMNRVRLVQVEGALFNIANALLIAILAYQLSGSQKLGLLAGLASDVNLVALSLVDTGCCEPAFVFVVALACVGLTRGGWHFYWAALLLGLSCLIRQFFVLLPFCLIAILILRRWTLGKSASPVFSRAQLVIGFLLFAIAPAAWCYRNYRVTGQAPILSTIRGETFYGSNNKVVADELATWGYWIMPDAIPGESPKAKLAQSMTELEVDRYYFRKGIDHLRANWFSMPRHLVGKLVRAYVPVPWVAIWPSYIAFSYRIAIYVLFAFTAGAAFREARASYRVVFEAMLAVSLLTTLMFYGTYRFVYCVEPFLLPMIAVGLRAKGWGIDAPRHSEEPSTSDGRAG